MEKKHFKFKEINFVPTENRIVVKLGKLYTWQQVQSIVDPKANEGRDLKTEDAILKRDVVDVKYNYQVVEIVGISEKETYYSVGDKVLVDVRNVREFDLYKDLYWLWRADIHGVVNVE